jgi:YD repeat-containing protein
MRHVLLISIVVIGLVVVSFSTSYAETTNYIYDELNRLIRVEYGDGSVVEYTYDKAGNRIQMTIPYPDSTPPTTTASPAGEAYNTAQTVTLEYDDGNGVGYENKNTPSTGGLSAFRHLHEMPPL